MEMLWHDLLNWGPRLLKGTWVTIYITIITMILATTWGLFLALLRIREFLLFISC